MNTLSMSPDAAAFLSPQATGSSPPDSPTADPGGPPPWSDADLGAAPMPLAAALETAGRERLAQLARRHTAGALMSALTHELSQPLAAIGMYSSAAARMLDLGRTDTAELSQVLRQIETQIGRAADLLAQVRALTRTGETPAATTDLCRGVADAVALVRPLAAGKQIELLLEAPPGALPIAADPVQISQVVLALLFNAIEAIDEAGPSERRIWVSIHPEPVGALVTVRDTGPGIGCGLDPGLRPGALGPVFPAGTSAKRHACGLGLAIGRAVIEAQGGQLWADSAATGGAVLHLRLPWPVDAAR